MVGIYDIADVLHLSVEKAFVGQGRVGGYPLLALLYLKCGQIYCILFTRVGVPVLNRISFMPFSVSDAESDVAASIPSGPLS